MNNYRYCAAFAHSVAGGAPLKVLDYGCGSGRLLALLVEDGHDAYGCDAWYEGGDMSRQVPDRIKNRIVAMEDGRIPFPGQSFDLVISNQVLEHVADIDMVLAEMSRVLRPGGRCLALFPHLEVWREGHTNIPFLHWFPKDSPARIRYATALRRLGLGYFKGDQDPPQWAQRVCQWLDDWCHYRPRREIERAFRQHLSAPRYIEPDWMAKRLPLSRFAPRFVRTFVARKSAGLVLVARR